MKKSITFRFDPDLLERAKRSAEADHRSLTNYVETAVLRAIDSNQISASPDNAPEAPINNASGKSVS